MFSISRSVIRWAIVGGVGVGGITLLIGPERVAAGFSQIKSLAVGYADGFVDDPILLRRQLDTLAEEYPQRIAEVQGELSQVRMQLKQIQHDTEVCDRVISMTSEDLAHVKFELARAHSSSGGQPVSIKARGRRFSVAEARQEATRIAGIKSAYQDRQLSNKHQLGFLQTQEQRLGEILVSLEGEFGQFETKLWQLDRQIDAIERNEKLIEMTRQQKAILASYDKFGKIGNLNQIEARLEELRTVQEAQLETLAKAGGQNDYEKMARSQLNAIELDLDSIELMDVPRWDHTDEPSVVEEYPHEDLTLNGRDPR